MSRWRISHFDGVTIQPPLTEEVQAATGHTVEVAFADQGYAGEQAARDAAQNGIELVVVRLPEAEKGFVLLPRRWVVERSFGRLTRFRRLVRDYERTSDVLRGLHFVAVGLMLQRLSNVPMLAYQCA